MQSFSGLFTCFLLAAVPALAQPYSMEGANRYVIARDWTNLLRYTQAWTKASPGDSNAWFYLGNTYLNGFQQPANAVGPLRRAVALKPQSPQVWFFLGSAYRQTNQFANAIDALKRATGQDPSHLNYWIGLAGAYTDQEYATPTAGAQNDAPALEALRRGMAAASPSTNATAWYDLGLAFDGLGASQDAAETYSRAIRLAPNTAEAWNNRGVDEEKLGQSQRALADYQQALNLGDRLAGENLQRLRAAISDAVAARRSGCPHPPGFTVGSPSRGPLSKFAFCPAHPGCTYYFQGAQFQCPR